MPQNHSDAKSPFRSVAAMASEPSSRPALSFNPEAYRQLVADGGLTRAQETALLEAMWTIVVSFVDLGFDLHPIQQVTGGIETLEEDSGSVLASKDISNKQTFLIADPSRKRAAERIDS